MVYRSPNQTSEEFNIFQENLQDIIGKIKDRKPHCIILTGDQLTAAQDNDGLMISTLRKA